MTMDYVFPLAENDAQVCASGAKEILATKSGSMKATM